MKKTLCMILALLVVLAGCAQTTQPDATPAATPEQTAPQGTETEQPDASAEPGTPDEPAKDTLVVALSADALSMDPARHTTYPTGTVLFHIYDPLVTRDANGNIQPWLAESWELLDDVTWQFKLKEGVTFTVSRSTRNVSNTAWSACSILIRRRPTKPASQQSTM